MGNFIGNRTVTLDNLRQVVNEEGKRIYSEELLQKIEIGDFNCLNGLNLSDRNNRYFMEPLLFAVKNSRYSTYEVYKYYGRDLQKAELTIATEIVMNEPEVIEDTTIANEPSIVLYLVEYNPEIIMYISDDLKSDGEFIEELCEKGDQEVIKHIAKECNISEALEENPNLASNPDFMKEAIKNDTAALSYASSELKDNYEFMKEVSNNDETIDYVIENIKDFGEKGLSGTRDALIEKSNDEAITGFEEEQKKVKKQIEEKSEESSDNSELEELLKRDKQLQRHIHFFERIRNGEVDPVRAAKLIDKICVNLDENYRAEIKRILKVDEAIAEKQKANEEKDGKKADGEITPEDIEKATDEARLPSVEKEITETKELIEEERKGRQQHTKEEIEVDD